MKWLLFCEVASDWLLLSSGLKQSNEMAALL